MQDWEWAWLAGIFEGEGSTSFTSRTGVRVSIGMTDKDVIESIHRLFPARNVHRCETKGRRKPLYLWCITDRDNVKSFLEGVLPYLHERRSAKANEALIRLEKNLGAKGKRTHCIYGHPLSGDNLYIAKTTGARSCLTCRARRDHERGPVRVPPKEGICDYCGKGFIARNGTQWCSTPCQRNSWRERRRVQGLPVL